MKNTNRKKHDANTIAVAVLILAVIWLILTYLNKLLESALVLGLLAGIFITSEYFLDNYTPYETEAKTK